MTALNPARHGYALVVDRVVVPCDDLHDLADALVQAFWGGSECYAKARPRPAGYRDLWAWEIRKAVDLAVAKILA